MRPLDPDRAIIQANDLAEAAFQGNLLARRLTLAALSCLEVDDDGRLVARVPVADFVRLFKITNSNIYELLGEAAANARAGTTVLYRDKRAGRWRSANLIDHAEYLPMPGGGRYVQIVFGSGIKPWVLGLEGNFNSFTLRNIAAIPRLHSLRLYEFLLHKSHRGAKPVHVTIEELKTVLYLRYPDNEGKIYEAYKANGEFMRSVVKKAHEELPETSNLRFTYTAEKYGNRLGPITFHVSVSGDEPVNDHKRSLSREEAALYKEIQELGYTRDIERLIKREGVAFLRSTLDLTRASIRQSAPTSSPIRNPGGFFSKLVATRAAEKIQLADEGVEGQELQDPRDVAKAVLEALEQERSEHADRVWDDLEADDRILVRAAMERSLDAWTKKRIDSAGWEGPLYRFKRKDTLLQLFAESFPSYLFDVEEWAAHSDMLDDYDREFQELVLEAARKELAREKPGNETSVA